MKHIFFHIIEKSRPVIFGWHRVIGSVDSKVAEIMGACNDSPSFF